LLQNVRAIEIKQTMSFVSSRVGQGLIDENQARGKLKKMMERESESGAKDSQASGEKRKVTAHLSCMHPRGRI